MGGLREKARDDLTNILGDPEGPGTPFILIAPDGAEYPVCGTYGDISLLIDPATGSAVQGRTITAAYPMALLKGRASELPKKGWKVRLNDLDGTQRLLFIVDPPDNDFTIGLTRLKLGANS